MSTDSATQDDTTSRNFRRRGALVLALFSVLWSAVAATGVAPELAWPVRIAGLVVAVAIIALAYRPGTVAERRRTLPENWHRTVGIVNGAQFALIAVIVLIGVNTGLPQIVPPAVALVVGLHFFPLARLFDQPQYTWTATGLCAAAVLGTLILVAGPSQEVSRLVIGAVAAITLWATALQLALRG